MQKSVSFHLFYILLDITVKIITFKFDVLLLKVTNSVKNIYNIIHVIIY